MTRFRATPWSTPRTIQDQVKDHPGPGYGPLPGPSRTRLRTIQDQVTDHSTDHPGLG